jgi:hypothetical protein
VQERLGAGSGGDSTGEEEGFIPFGPSCGYNSVIRGLNMKALKLGLTSCASLCCVVVFSGVAILGDALPK